ncbi:MAG: GTPase Era [Elusimicrobia bacterium]|nr:GTPase Era [Elusimicrobiota bacterium]
MTPQAHRAGFAAILGRPNAGKSTLMNALLGQTLSIVSPRPQTTRHKILGIANSGDYQLIFVDTPGWLDAAKDRLQGALRWASQSAARDDTDILIWVADDAVQESERALIESLSRFQRPMILVLAKADIKEISGRLRAGEAAWRAMARWDSVFHVSAKTGQGVTALRSRLIALLPESPPYYPKDQASDRYERFFAAEIIRERIFELYDEEIPHAATVEIESYREEPGRSDRISASVIVERESQKGIVIGKGGAAIRRLREQSVQGIEAFTGRPVELEIRVRVEKNWRQNSESVRRLGY